MYEALLNNIQTTVQAMIKKVLEDNEDILEGVYGRNIQRLHTVATTDFLRITYEDAIALLNQYGYSDIAFGDDLKAEHEAIIIELLNNGYGIDSELPVFVMKFPKEIKFFNMKVSSKDPRVCLSADLIFPYAGEATGAAVREHDFPRLKERLITSAMYEGHLRRGGKYEDFKWYLDIIEKQGTQPHAGYGVGNDRVLNIYLVGKIFVMCPRFLF